MASNVAFYSLIILIASMCIGTEARNFDMNALGIGVDYFNEGDHHYSNNDRAIRFGGVDDDSIERNGAISNVVDGRLFERHENGSPFLTFEASARGGGGIRKTGNNPRDRIRRREEKERLKQKKQQEEFTRRRKEKLQKEHDEEEKERRRRVKEDEDPDDGMAEIF